MQPRLADPGLALDDDRRAAAGREAVDDGPQPVAAPPPGRRPARPAAATAGTPASPSSRKIADRPGLAAQQLRPARSSTSSPFRAARTVASSRRISPGRAIALDPGGGRDRRPGQRPVERRRRARSPATTSPVAIPIRTWSGSPATDPSTVAQAASRIASAQWAARSASSSWPCGQPNTANTASPMNFSRVPSNALIAVDHRPERRVDLAGGRPRDRARRRAGRSRRDRRTGRSRSADHPLRRPSRGRVARSARAGRVPAARRTGRRTWPIGRVGAPHAPHRTRRLLPHPPRWLDPPGRV